MTKKMSGVLVRCLVVFIAAFGTGLAISMYYVAALGSDPYSMFVEALSMRLGVSAGTMSMTCNIAIVLWAVVFARQLIGIGTFIQAFTVGVGIDLGALVWSYVGVSALPLRVLFSFTGAVLGGCFIALYLACEMGASPIDMLVLTVAARFRLRYQLAFYAVYAVLFLLGMLLGGIWGIGTVIALLTTGFVADKMRPRCDKLFKTRR